RRPLRPPAPRDASRLAHRLAAEPGALAGRTELVERARDRLWPVAELLVLRPGVAVRNHAVPDAEAHDGHHEPALGERLQHGRAEAADDRVVLHRHDGPRLRRQLEEEARV